MLVDDQRANFQHLGIFASDVGSHTHRIRIFRIQNHSKCNDTILMSCLSLGVCSKTFSSTIFNFYQQILLRLNNFTFPNHPLPSSVGASNWRFCRSCSSAPPTAGPGVNDPTVVAIFPSGSTGSDGAIMTVLPGVLTLSQVKVCEFTRRKNAKNPKHLEILGVMFFGGDVFVVACSSCFFVSQHQWPMQPFLELSGFELFQALTIHWM